jgi:hypothetical protein
MQQQGSHKEETTGRGFINGQLFALFYFGEMFPCLWTLPSDIIWIIA